MGAGGRGADEGRGADGSADRNASRGALELTAYKFELALRQPVLTSRGPVSKRNGILVSLADSDGLVGWGQSMPLPHLSPDVLASELGCVLRQPGQQQPQTLSEFMAAAADQTHCLSALSSAWCDLRARQSQLGLGEWLARGTSLADGTRPADAGTQTDGQRKINHLPLSALIDPSSVAESGARARDEGYRAVKLKIGSSDFTQDLEAVRQLRQAVGDDVKLRLDANGAWDLEAAGQHICQLAEHDIDYIEEPVSGLAELGTLEELARHSPVDIAADESIGNIGDLRRALGGGRERDGTGRADRRRADGRRGISVLVIKPTVLGNLEQLLAVLTGAEQPCRVVITSAMDSSLGIACAAHFGAALAWRTGTAPADIEPCGLDTARLLADDLCQPGIDISHGQISLPDGHGLGVAPTKQALELYAEEIAKFALS